ncbi:uncharacterized protein LOC131433842 [Malaya genurostris]|uniref:uncharacterized protein LOC131433842 n=1 Tax=Malaya genurostris TaxID=325434 RepID=UPI0026F3F763|nr:uncharacterized protein LOC131433842 [Malaya genurostris]
MTTSTVKAAINNAAECTVGYVERSRRNEAAGKDGIAAELIKMDPEKLATFGFIDGRSTTDQIFTVQKILQKYREYQVPTHHPFIDFKAAYVGIDRIELWKIVDETSFPGKLTSMIQATMDGVQNYVRVFGELSSSFGSRRGLRQGDGLSCLLFNIALERVMRRAGLNSRGTIFTKSSQFVCFADDMDIIARHFGTVAESYTRLKREAANVELVVNASKTVGGTEHDRIRLESNVMIDGDTFEVVEEFVYLGSLLTADNNMKKNTKTHPQWKSCLLRAPKKNFRSKKIHLRTKCTMYKTLIRPVILYGHEAWIMLEEDLQALGDSERRVLRTIFGGVQKNGVWRRRMNHELAGLYGEPSIQKEAKAGRIWWAGHVARIPNNNPTKLVFATNPLGTKRWGVQQARWVNQVERDLASIGRDREWRAAATNLEKTNINKELKVNLLKLRKAMNVAKGTKRR